MLNVVTISLIWPTIKHGNGLRNEPRVPDDIIVIAVEEEEHQCNFVFSPW